MELRHLRYFVAVAEEGSSLTAAQRRLNTSQPSLSRQIRDLESEIGVKLLERQARGVALTAMMSGRFLTRGIKGTSTEMELSVLGFNMIRSINLRATPT